MPTKIPLNPSAKIYLPFPAKGHSYIHRLRGILLFPIVNKGILLFPLVKSILLFLLFKYILPFPLVKSILLFPLVKCILPFPLARWVFIPIPLIMPPLPSNDKDLFVKQCYPLDNNISVKWRHIS